MAALEVRASAAADVGELVRFLDQATAEVFSTMMGAACTPSPEPGPGMPEHEAISAVIGLAGVLSGSLVLSTEGHTAMRMAERMTGIAPLDVDEMVRDAIGEVCNMVAGAWKGFDPTLASRCLLSTPTVVAGTDYEVFSQKAPIRIEREYAFEERSFTIAIACEPQG
ncbi:MAG: chemotaxis protein CheX [Acidobacteriota bacterium]